MQERVRKKLIMPDLVGLVERDAQIMLTTAGFNPSVVQFVDGYDDIDTVVQQAPTKGQLIDSSSEIQIKVCKQSYIRYLPQIFQVDAALGNSFLKEYLWIFQHILQSITTKLDNGHHYFDPRETPTEFLSWLSSWVALAMDVDWPEIKKRKLIRAAAEQYRHRGTRGALVHLLEVFVGKRPTILENESPYRGFRIGVSSVIGVDTVILPPLNLDHCFVVQVPVRHDEITEEMVVKIHNIINMEKPAHTTYFLHFQTDDPAPRPHVFMQIGVASTVGAPELRYEDVRVPVTVPEPEEVATTRPKQQTTKKSAAPTDEKTKPAQRKKTTKKSMAASGRTKKKSTVSKAKPGPKNSKRKKE